MTGQDYKAGCPPLENSVVPENRPAADGGDDNDDEDTVDPWNVATTNAKGVDYDKLIGRVKMSTTREPLTALFTHNMNVSSTAPSMC